MHNGMGIPKQSLILAFNVELCLQQTEELWLLSHSSEECHAVILLNFNHRQTPLRGGLPKKISICHFLITCTMIKSYHEIDQLYLINIYHGYIGR